MKGQRGRLTAQQGEFVRLVVEQGCSYVDAYRASYPARSGTRSAKSERVAAKRLAHRPHVEKRLEELREQFQASDSDEMRRRANVALSRILAGRLDARFRRTAMDVLHYLDQQEREGKNVELETYLSAAARILNVVEPGRRSRQRAALIRALPEVGTVGAPDEGSNESSALLAPESSQDDERRRAEILQVVSDRQRARFGEKPAFQMIRGIDDQRDDSLPPATQQVPAEDLGFRRERKPGYFGRGGWKRHPVPV